ncbi:beta-phosphoglucomutase-like phosphatase (HAD superfamily) [Peptoniphilus ivorii]|uniref:HAD family hydrolase n=1 Tax=Aedoeadaptatus ivorii TaxID=54006 RepID=UPI0027807CB3|nr:HAD family phosphatase [Peptoniphilus ivorii]MDQ0507945.1 beta-phosphoglucomutase-like phosphatase (HAD superfamily) [Peptoniphilus ivorii]
MKKALAFDFDGTLIDSMGLWRHLGRNFIESRGLTYTDEIDQTISTMSLSQSSKFFKEYFQFEDAVPAIYEEMSSILYLGYSETLLLKPGAAALVEKSARLVPTVLATATNEALLAPALTRFDLKKYFAFIQTCDSVGLQKSDRRYFDTLAERLEVAPEDIVFFDDAPYALRSAKEAGFYTVGVWDEHNQPHWDDVLAHSDETVKDLENLDPGRFV